MVRSKKVKLIRKTKRYLEKRLYQHKIPSILIQTSKDPPLTYVVDQLKERSIGWKYIHFVDKDILQFFKDHPLKEFPKITEVFHSFEKGEHKADLFRYYFLYVKGGVFIDSDAMIEVDLDKITRNYEFFSVDTTPIGKKAIFQGFIGCIAKHPIIYKALKDLYSIKPEELKDYSIVVKHLYTIYHAHKNAQTILYPERWKIPSISETHDGETVLLTHYWKKGYVPKNKKV